MSTMFCRLSALAISAGMLFGVDLASIGAAMEGMSEEGEGKGKGAEEAKDWRSLEVDLDEVMVCQDSWRVRLMESFFLAERALDD